ncbi:MAG TPA: beta-N-acetylhexosaminidase [Nannocystaceae bacterium]|nr:beta-N-acetylhexosaminidase [Nannocystaceae bacterium]
MAARWQPGQLLFVGFAGTSPPHALLDLVAAGRVGGVILFTRNLPQRTEIGPDGKPRTVLDPAALRSLVASLRARAPADAPLSIAIDQEGGRVQRLRSPWTEWPPMRRLGELDMPSWSADVATALARELADLGIGLDFAPDVDVDSNPANPVIGDRSFGRTPEIVATHAAAFVRALQAAGVAACAKHFPGHGDTHEDSHFALPSLPHDLDRLLEVELPPFAAAIEAGVASIMTAHIVFEAIDRKRPATFSPDVLALLRERLAFDRVVFSDDLEMKAVVDSMPPRKIPAAALAAGIDALLVCEQLDFAAEVLDGLEHCKDAALEAPLARVAAFKAAFPGPVTPLDDEGRETPPAGPPYPEHLALAERLRRGVERRE